MTDSGGPARVCERRAVRCRGRDERVLDRHLPAYRPVRRRGVRQPGALVGPDAPAGLRRRAERARLDADLEGRDRRRQRADRRRRLLPAGARDDLRRDRRPLRPRRAGRPRHRGGRAPAPWRAGAGRRSAVPPHAVGQRPDRRQRRLLRDDRAREGDPAAARRRGHQDRADGVRRRGRRRRRVDVAQQEIYAIGEKRQQEDYAPLSRSWRPPSTRSRRSRKRRHQRRRADRVRRPRRAHQRLLRRPDDHRRRAPRGR